MSLLAGFEIQPLHVVYMLLDLLTSTLFGMSFDLAVHLTWMEQWWWVHAKIWQSYSQVESQSFVQRVHLSV